MMLSILFSPALDPLVGAVAAMIAPDFGPHLANALPLTAADRQQLWLECLAESLHTPRRTPYDFCRDPERPAMRRLHAGVETLVRHRLSPTATERLRQVVADLRQAEPQRIILRLYQETLVPGTVPVALLLYQLQRARIFVATLDLPPAQERAMLAQVDDMALAAFAAGRTAALQSEPVKVDPFLDETLGLLRLAAQMPQSAAAAPVKVPYAPPAIESDEAQAAEGRS
ncbi:MAG: hypothetical protein IT477_10340 [Rhodanobacteraceae bacterium]|nr:hypothetical protein [Rhodanobacteraceae bacterium]